MKKKNVLKNEKDFPQIFSRAMHDIKNPLSSILVLMQLLQREIKQYDNEKANSHIARMHTQADILLDFLNQMSFMVKSVTNSFELQLEFVPLNSILKEAFTENCAIKNQIPQNIEIIADFKLLAHALALIVSYIQKKSPNEIAIEVILEKDTIKILFSPFPDMYALDNWGRVSENGFALPIASAIISKHNGEMSIQKRNGYTILICSIPVRIDK